MGKRRTPSEKNAAAPAAVRRLEQDMIIWRLKVDEGLNNSEVGERIGMDPGNVSKAINRIFSTYRTALTGEVEAQAGVLAARYEHMYKEAIAAWERSKEQGRTVTRTVGRRRQAGQSSEEAAALNGESEHTTVSQGNRDGNPVFLDTAMKALAKWQAMLGLDTPQKIQLQAEVSGGVQHRHEVRGVVAFRHEMDTSAFDEDQLRNYLQEMGTAALQFAQTTMLPPAHDAAEAAKRGEPVIIDQDSAPSPGPPVSLPLPQTTTESDQ